MMYLPDRSPSLPAMDDIQSPAPVIKSLPVDDARLRSHSPPSAHPESNTAGTVELVGNNYKTECECNGRRNIVPPGSYLDVVIDELGLQIQQDSQAVVFLEQELLEKFLKSVPRSDRLSVLPAPEQTLELSLTLSWCRRLAQGGHRPILVLTEGFFQSLFGQLRELLSPAPLPIRLIIVPSPASSAVGRCAEPGAARPVLAFLRLLPGIVVAVPKDSWELRQMLAMAAPAADRAVAVQVPCTPLPTFQFPDFAETIEIGKAEILEEGTEIALLALGSMVVPAVKAAEILSRRGISAGVVNARFVEPLDRSLIGELAGEVRGMLTLEEEGGTGGFGTAVLELLADSGISTPVTVSGAVGIYGGSEDEAVLVQQVVSRAVALVDRLNGTEAAVRRPPRRLRPEKARPGEDHFGFSSEVLQHEHELVKAHGLSPAVDEWFRIYSQVGERKRYLFQWCAQGAELTTLPCVVPDLFQHVNDTKLLTMILCVLLDDVADLRGPQAFLELLLRIVGGQLEPDLTRCNAQERTYAEVTLRLTETWFARMREYPCFAMFESLLRYDQIQYFNALRYSNMLNRNPWLMNPLEHDLYFPHGMDMMSYATTDLMCSPGFPIEELGRLREAVWHLQCMGQVGNLLATWRREVRQHDFASGVFARAIIQGDLSIDQLHPDNFGAIETAIVEGGHELYYFGRWKYHRDRFLEKARYVRGLDLKKLLDGNDRLFLMHLGSRGML
jgi:transketolase C-terminal domain/subunit